MTDNMFVLETCPFCGSEATSRCDFSQHDSYNGTWIDLRVGCAKCNIYKHNCIKLDSMTFDAVVLAMGRIARIWNTRINTEETKNNADE